jgi:hypothetical protein
VAQQGKNGGGVPLHQYKYGRTYFIRRIAPSLGLKTVEARAGCKRVRVFIECGGVLRGQRHEDTDQRNIFFLPQWDNLNVFA